jgi:hypothetical protein
VDDSRSDDDPQGGHDVRCWRTPGASFEHGVPNLDEPMDCMTCIVMEARRAASHERIAKKVNEGALREWPAAKAFHAAMRKAVRGQR